jgi:CheY-like chemotaxis protein
MKRVLVVEDNDLVMGMLLAVIEFLDKSIEVDHVESAEEALELFEPNKYTLIITDISLIGMNGLELCLKIRKIDKEVQVIGISGYNSLLNTNNLGIAGFNSWFTKPDGYADFIKEIEKIIKDIDK